MGFLLAGVNKELFEIIWEGWQIPGAVRPDNRLEIRTAAQIQKQLETRSAKQPHETSFNCPTCRFLIKLENVQIDNEWRIIEKRALNDDATPLFFENDQFSYFMKVMGTLKPPQARLMLFNELWDVLEDVEKNWKGDEPTLRQKYENWAVEPAKS